MSLIKTVLKVTDKSRVDAGLRELQKRYDRLESGTRSFFDARFWGSFRKRAFAFLKQALPNLSLDILESVIKRTFGSSLIASASALVGFVYSLFPGSKFILKYLAVQTLITSLEKRIALNRALHEDVRQITSILNSIISANLALDNNSRASLVRAKSLVTQALAVLGREVSKMQRNEELLATNYPNGTRPVPLDAPALRRARQKLVDAINQLTYGFSGLSQTYEQRIAALNEKYSIKTQSYRGMFTVDHSGIFDFRKLNRWLVDVKIELVDSPEIAEKYLSEAIQRSGVGPYVGAHIALIYLVDNIYDLIRHFPIYTGIAVNVGLEATDRTIGGGITAPNLVRELDNFRDQLSPLLSQFIPRKPEQRLGYSSPDITWAGSNLEVAVAEGAVAGLETWYTEVRRSYGLSLINLIKSYTLTKEVSDEITQYLEQPGTFEDSIGPRSGWAFKLRQSIDELDSVLAPNITITTPDGQQINLNQDFLEKAFYDASVSYQKLVDTINSTEDSTATEILELANSELSSFWASSLFYLMGIQTRQKTVRGLQAIRLSLDRVLAKDRQKLALCRQFITDIDRVRIFPILYKEWQRLFERFQDDKSSGIERALGIQNGDLSRIATGGALLSDAIARGKSLVSELDTSILSEASLSMFIQAIDLGDNYLNTERNLEVENARVLEILKGKRILLENMSKLS